MNSGRKVKALDREDEQDEEAIIDICPEDEQDEEAIIDICPGDED